MGIDLGTADIVVMVLNATGEPVACFLEWAEVVRDGVVVDYAGAVDIVRRLVGLAQKKLGVEFAGAATSFPPGTEPRLSTYILERVGLAVTAVQDEPTCVANLLELDRTAVVDVGGGTTGTAVVRKGKVVFSGDQPTGGRHISLVIAGHYGISFQEAEERKRQPINMTSSDWRGPRCSACATSWPATSKATAWIVLYSRAARAACPAWTPCSPKSSASLFNSPASRCC